MQNIFKDDNTGIRINFADVKSTQLLSRMSYGGSMYSCHMVYYLRINLRDQEPINITYNFAEWKYSTAKRFLDEFDVWCDAQQKENN